MALGFHPHLVNDPFGDPALYVESSFAKRALLFDLGTLEPLAPRKILRITHAFVSHAHIDHFAGFDRILRIRLNREMPLHLFGPAEFIDRVQSKLAAYTWNLVTDAPAPFTVVATEVHGDGTRHAARFTSSAAFAREDLAPQTVERGLLVDEETFSVRAEVLDHRTPCLGFALEEKEHLNVWKTRLAALGLPSGPWLTELKRAARCGEPDDRPFRVAWREAGRACEREFPLGALRRELLSVTPGQKLAYVVDTVYDEANAERIVGLARGANVLFVEAPFLDAEAAMAREKYHLTARQAGMLAREAGVKRVEVFHFSPRHLGREDDLRREAQAAFAEPALSSR